MLTTDQVDRFRTFGFIVLRGYLADRIGVLRTETDAAIRDAYAATCHERVIDGISGHYLAMTSRLTPVSASLACDDPRFSGAAGQLLGGPVIPERPEGVLYFSAAGWHPMTASACAVSSSPPTSRSSPPARGRCGWCPARTTRTRTPGSPPTASAGSLPGALEGW